MNGRKAKRDRARKKINTYQNCFNNAAEKYLSRMGDKMVTLHSIMQSKEMIDTLMSLEKLNPKEKALIEAGLKNFCAAIYSENKEALSNG